ncbi:MAG: hypothetical protein ACYC5O_13350 [Anaerolineae bacterium]
MSELWLHGQVHDDEAASAEAARDAGVVAVVAAGSAAQATRLRALGLRPWACLGAFSVRPGEIDLQCRSVDGEPRLWFGSGCPSNRFLRDRLYERVRALAAWPVEGVLLDGIRFASPYDGAETFFTCTCPWCRAAATDRGFNFTRITSALKGAASSLEDLGTQRLRLTADGLQAPVDLLPPLLTDVGLAEWLAFRATLIVDIVRSVRQEMLESAPGMKLGAYLFTPSLAPLVGQDYARLEPLLDVVSPMIYRFGDGPACLPAEVLALSRFCPNADADAATLAAAALLGLEPPTAGGEQPEMGVAAIARECTRARSRLGRGANLVPILWLDDPQIREAVAAVTAGAPDGVSFYPSGDHRAERLGQAAAYLRVSDSSARQG